MERIYNYREFPSNVENVFQWYAGEDLKKVDADLLTDLALDFLEDDLDMPLEDVAEFINEHWLDRVVVRQTDIGNCYDTQMEIAGKELVFDADDWLAAPFRMKPF